MKRFLGQRIVVLGGAGFLGSHLCEKILDEGASRVIAVDNLVTGSERNIAHIRTREGFSFLSHDVTLPIPDVGTVVDRVFNLASPASPIDYARLPLETLRTSALGTDHGLMLAQRHGAVFLQASTSEVYGDPLVHPQHESYFGNVDPTGPRAVYDEAKRYAEALACAYARMGAKVRIARIFNTYGPRMRLSDGRVVPAFVGQALANEDFTVFGDGKQTRSFCYVEDLVEGLCRLSLSSVDGPVNIGNPQEMTMLQFAEAVREAAGGGGQIVFRPFPQGDPKQRRPDISRARELLQWEPKVSLPEGLRRTVDYFRKVAGPVPGS